MFSWKKEPLPCLVSIPCALLKPGLVLLGEAGPASASCIGVETGTWRLGRGDWDVETGTGSSSWGPPVRPLPPSPVPQSRTRFPLPEGLGSCLPGCRCSWATLQSRSPAVKELCCQRSGTSGARAPGSRGAQWHRALPHPPPLLAAMPTQGRDRSLSSLFQAKELLL